MQPLTERKNLPQRWNNKMKLQVLNADNEPPNVWKTNLQGTEMMQGGEEARTTQRS